MRTFSLYLCENKIKWNGLRVCLCKGWQTKTLAVFVCVCIGVHGSTYEPDGKETWKRKEGKWLNLDIWKTHFPLLYHLPPPFKQAVTLTAMYCHAAACPSLPGCIVSWSGCHSRICHLLSSKQSKTNSDKNISESREKSTCFPKTFVVWEPWRPRGMLRN